MLIVHSYSKWLQKSITSNFNFDFYFSSDFFANLRAKTFLSSFFSETIDLYTISTLVHTHTFGIGYDKVFHTFFLLNFTGLLGQWL